MLDFRRTEERSEIYDLKINDFWKQNFITSKFYRKKRNLFDKKTNIIVFEGIKILILKI
jgi:hypothetical protein